MKKMLKSVGLVVCAIMILNTTNNYKTYFDGVFISKQNIETKNNDGEEHIERPSYSKNVVVKDSDNEQIVVCSDAITGLSDSQYDEILDDMYEKVEDEYIDNLDEMEPKEINEILNSFDEKYELGEPFSEEDTATFLYVYEKTHLEENNENDNSVNANLCGWETLTYNIGTNKIKDGVKTSYKGTFKTWTGSMHGQYDTNVDVKIEKGKDKLKSMKWTTYHDAYGILGSSGKSVSIGKVYTGHVSSDKYKKNFSFDKTVKYSAVWTVYISTHGTLDVKYDGGEYSINTKVYKSAE